MEDQGVRRPVTFMSRSKYIFLKTWRFFFCITVPILLLPIIIFWEPEKQYEKAPFGLYITVLTAVFWVSECIPLGITSFIPIVLVPLFDIADSGVLILTPIYLDAICGEYFNQTTLFLLGGCIVALAFEYSDLHTRISYFVMKSVGAKATTLLFGMMMTSAVLSCWMNNTSTTAMMVPVIISIMEQYKSKLIPKGTAQELAEKYGSRNADEISQFVESRVTVPAKSTTSQLPEVNDMEGTRTNRVEPEKSLVDTVVALPDPTGVVEQGQHPSLNILLQPHQQQTDESTYSVAMKVADTRYWEGVIESKKKYVRNLEVMFLVGVAVASNIGGTGVITGTGTNLIAISELRKFRQLMKDKPGLSASLADSDKCFEPKNGYWDLDFLKWIMLNFLPMLVNVLVSWAFLALFFQGLPSKIKNLWRRMLRKPPDYAAARRERDISQVATAIRHSIRAKYEGLGRTTFHQWMILILFSLLVCLWILKNPMFGRGPPVPFTNPHKISQETLKLIHPACAKEKSRYKLESEWGWTRFFGDDCDPRYLHDYVSTLLVCFLLFVIPKDLKYYRNAFRGGIGEGLDDPLLHFDFVAQNMPWGVLFMLGGGFGISLAIRDSKLDELLGNELIKNEFLQKTDVSIILGLALISVAVLTSVASNTATAVIVCPILILLALVKGVPPLYLVVPPVVGASYAFCLPISTPPNAIVYDKGNMKQMDMFLPGIFLTFICNGILYLITLTVTYLILDVPGYDGSCNKKVEAAVQNSRMLLQNSASGRSLFDDFDS